MQYWENTILINLAGCMESGAAGGTTHALKGKYFKRSRTNSSRRVSAREMMDILSIPIERDIESCSVSAKNEFSTCNPSSKLVRRTRVELERTTDENVSLPW
jgi:hypothetical protein